MIKRLFAGAGIIFLPFIFAIGVPDEMRVPKAQALALMAALYGAYVIGKKIDFLLGCFAAFVSISALFRTLVIPFEDIIYFWGALGSAFWVSNASDDTIRDGLNLFEGVAIVAALYSIFQICGKDPLMTYYPWAESWRPTVMFGQHTLYGPFAVAGFMVALFRRHYPICLITFFPIVVINSSFTFLSLAVGAAIWTFYTYRRAIPHIVVILIIIGVIANHFYPNKKQEILDDKGRYSLWAQTFELSKRRPLFGHGFGSFKDIYPIFQLPELRKANGIDDEKLTPKTRAFMAEAKRLTLNGNGIFVSSHNDLVQVFFELGGFGVLLVFSMLAFFLIKVRNKLHNPLYQLLLAMFLGFIADSFGSFPFRLVPQALIPLWIYVVVVSRSDIMGERESWPIPFVTMNFIDWKMSFWTLLGNMVTNPPRLKRALVGRSTGPRH